MIEELILFVICVYAMASVVVEQKIFQEPRKYIKDWAESRGGYLPDKICQLISCMFCSGFWCGVFIAFIGLNPILWILFDSPGIILSEYLLSWFLSGLLGAFASYILHLLVSLLVMICGKHGIDT